MMSRQGLFVSSMEMEPSLIPMKLLTALPNIFSVKLSWLEIQIHKRLITY